MALVLIQILVADYQSNLGPAAIATLHDLLSADDSEDAFGLHARPLGNVMYLMCSLNTSKETRNRLEAALLKQFT